MSSSFSRTATTYALWCGALMFLLAAPAAVFAGGGDGGGDGGAASSLGFAADDGFYGNNTQGVVGTSDAEAGLGGGNPGIDPMTTAAVPLKTVPPTTKLPPNVKFTPKALKNAHLMDPKAKAMLATIASKVNFNITVTSTYRSPTHNEDVNGAKKSQHMNGLAVDISTAGLTSAQKDDLGKAISSTVGVNGWGFYASSVHVDARQTSTKAAWGPNYSRTSLERGLSHQNEMADEYAGWSGTPATQAPAPTGSVSEPTAPAPSDSSPTPSDPSPTPSNPGPSPSPSPGPGAGPDSPSPSPDPWPWWGTAMNTVSTMSSGLQSTWTTLFNALSKKRDTMPPPSPQPIPVNPGSCPMEVKQCPDGSYVGRTPPACVFAACPATELSEDDPNPITCPADVKICPGGSTVGRTAPACQFAACPLLETKETVDENDITFEVTTLNTDGATSIDWTTDDVTVQSGQQLGFRWDASSYGRCLLFLGDDGAYSILSGRGTGALSGNTVTERYDVPERTGAYRIECSEQSNGEGPTDEQSINVTASPRATGLPVNPSSNGLQGVWAEWGTPVSMPTTYYGGWGTTQ